jgi:imidazolonepropionase
VRRGAALNDLGIIPDGSVLIRDGRIVSVGPARRIENLKEAREAVEISAEGAIIMPGFVDPGLHLSLHYRNGGPGLPVKRRKMADFSDECLGLLRACLQHGTLNAQVKANSGTGDFRSDLTVLRQLAEIGDNPVGMVRSWRMTEPVASDSQSSHAALNELIGLLADRHLANFLEVTPDSSDAFRRRVWQIAAEYKIRMNLLWPGGPSGLLEQALAGGNPHTIWCPYALGVAECALIAASRMIAVFCPNGELLDGSGIDSVRRLAASDAAFALSSGYDGSDTLSFNMQMIISLAVLRLRLTVEQAITAVTINAAHAIGRGDDIGTIECGKRADLIVLSVPDYREIPRRLGINHVVMAIRDGNIVFNRSRSRAIAG